MSRDGNGGAITPSDRSKNKIASLFVIPPCNQRGSALQRVASILVAFVVLSLVSFLMLWLGDKIKGSGMAYTRYLARAQAPLTGQWYPSAGRDQITVLTYDRQFLRDTQSSWPITYGHHADWLQRIAEDETTRPRGVFLDITFTEERDDPSITQLRDTLCRLKHEYGVDIYLASLAAPSDKKLHVRPELQARADDCFKLVSVNYIPDSLDGIAWDYPLFSHAGDKGWTPGLPPHGQPILESAALSMAKNTGRISLEQDSESMSLVWGLVNNQPHDDAPNLFDYCKEGHFSLWRLVPGLLRSLMPNQDTRPLCPYNTTYSISQLNELPEEQLKSALNDKFILIGAVVPGYNDIVESPVHGSVPGVYLHAMALDNLLVYGAEYKRSRGWDWPVSLDLLKAGLASVSIVLFVHLLWNCMLARSGLKKRFHLDRGKTLKDRFKGLAPRFVSWALRMTVQTTITMGLIVVLQRFVNIGMLPVVELVGMTILAEGLNSMDKLQAFFTDDQEQSDARKS